MPVIHQPCRRVVLSERPLCASANARMVVGPPLHNRVMDPTPIVATAVGSLIALLTQRTTTRLARDVAQREIDYRRWDDWRVAGPNVHADLMACIRPLDAGFDTLARLTDVELAALRQRVEAVTHSIDHLSALALERRVADWSSHLAPVLWGLASRLPPHQGCDDPVLEGAYEDRRLALHERFEWNDGECSTVIDRFLDALRAAAEPPSARKRRRRCGRNGSLRLEARQHGARSTGSAHSQRARMRSTRSIVARYQWNSQSRYSSP